MAFNRSWMESCGMFLWGSSSRWPATPGCIAMSRSFTMLGVPLAGLDMGLAANAPNRRDSSSEKAGTRPWKP